MQCFRQKLIQHRYRINNEIDFNRIQYNGIMYRY